MKRNPARPLVFAASLFAAAAVIGADTKPKKAAAAPAAAPKEDAKTAAAPANPDTVLATVNGEAIKSGEVDSMIAKILAQRGMPADALPPGQRDQIVRSMLDDLIMDKLVAKASSTVNVTDADVDAEFAKIRERRGGTDEDVKKELATMGMTVESLKGEIKGRMKQRQWVDSQIKGKYKEATEPEAKEFYDKNAQYFEQPEQVRASHILFRLEKTAKPEEISAAMKKAEQAITRAQKEDFSKLAGELSEEPGAKERGGDLSFFPRKGAMVEPFAEAAFKLQKDEITKEPVRTDFGYHVIKVTDRKPKSKPIEAVTPPVSVPAEPKKK